MSSERYETIDYAIVEDVQLQSSSEETSTGSASLSSDPERERAQEAHPTAFRKFATTYDALVEAIETRERQRVFDVLGLPNPYNSEGESARPRFSAALREAVPDVFFENLECEAAPEYDFEGLFTGVSWGGGFRYGSARQFALRVAWMMHVPSGSDAVREYFDNRAAGHLRDLGAEFAPPAPGSRGDQFEERVRGYVESCGLPLGPRRFRVETSEGVKRRVLDINTEVGGEAVVCEVYTDMSSYVNKTEQVRDYARLYSLTDGGEGELPHACEVTDTKQSRIFMEVVELLIDEEIESVPSFAYGGGRESETTYELSWESSSEYGSLPDDVLSHESRVTNLLDAQGMDWSMPMLSVTSSQSGSSRYGLGQRSRSSTETRHVPLGPTVERGSVVVSFLSACRGEELSVSEWVSGVETAGGSVWYPVVVADEEYVRGQSVSVVDPVVFGELLRVGGSGVQAPF